MSLPYYKRFPRDFLEGSIGMSLETKGAYAIVLDLIYMRDGRLPDDARFIAGQLGCSVRKWSAIREELIARGKLKVEEGFISNFRADYLLEETRKYQDNQAEKAGRPRKNKDLPQPRPSQSEPEPEKKEEPTVPCPVEPDAPKAEEQKAVPLAGPTQGQLDQIWALTPRLGRERSSRGDLKRAVTASMRRGNPFDAILAGVEAAYASETYSDRHAKGVHRLVEQDRFLSFIEAEPEQPQAEAEDPWPFRLSCWQRDRHWREAWGPPPDKPGCRAPPIERQPQAA